MMRTHRWIVSGLVISLVAWTSPALAAADAEAQEHVAPEAMETMVRELQAGGLSAAEAREIADQATREVVGTREGPERGGMPEGVNRDPTQMTQSERALMNQVQTLEQDLQKQGLSQEQIHQQIESQMGDKLRETGGRQGEKGLPGQRDDAKLQELSERGVPGMERAPGLEQRGGTERGASERQGSERGSMERGGQERGSSERGGAEHQSRESERPSMERSGREMERPSMEREHSSREMERPTMERESASREMERPAMEREVPTREIERPTMEREIERPTMEREAPMREMERPTMERPEMERPTMERPTMEMERPTTERPAGTP